MASKTALRGLCKNCVNGSSCTFLNGRRPRVIQCEEYVAITRVEKEPLWVNPAADDELAVSSNGRRGLCRSCGRWQECAFPRAVGGVWHCEEYC